MRGVILFITALILTGLFTAFAIVWTPIQFFVSMKWKSGLRQVNQYFTTLAVSIDQFGNASSGMVLNGMFLKRRSEIDSDENTERLVSFMLFGDIDVTISYVLGVNKYLDNLTTFGKFIVWVLDKIDKNHVEKALESQYRNDRDARERLSKPLYYYNR